MTRFQSAQLLSVVMSAALVLVTWLPTVSTPQVTTAQNAVVITALV